MKQSVASGVTLLSVALELIFGQPTADATRLSDPTPRSEHVIEAQAALRDLGYKPGPVDGIVGPRTQDALRRYQRSEGLQVTGRLDAETMVRLDIYVRLFRRPVRGHEDEDSTYGVADRKGALQSP